MSILTDPEIQVVTYWTIERLTMVFTAIGTVGATIVALWFGCRSGRAKLKVKTEFHEDLKITATNLSQRLVTITKIFWRVGRKGNRLWVQSPASSVRLREGSVKLEPGEPGFFYISLGSRGDPPSWLRWLEEYIPHFDNPIREHIEALRLKIHTSEGYTKQVVPPKDFLKALGEALEQHAPKPKIIDVNC